MKPYIEVKGTKVHLPQSVDPHQYEVFMMEFGDDYFYLLCKKVGKRYFQATGVVMERKGNDLIFHKDGSLYFQTKLGGSLGTRLTISSTGAATFSSVLTTGGNVLINNPTASKKGFTYKIRVV